MCYGDNVLKRLDGLESNLTPVASNYDRCNPLSLF